MKQRNSYVESDKMQKFVRELPKEQRVKVLESLDRIAALNDEALAKISLAASFYMHRKKMIQEIKKSHLPINALIPTLEVADYENSRISRKEIQCRRDNEYINRN